MTVLYNCGKMENALLWYGRRTSPTHFELYHSSVKKTRSESSMEKNRIRPVQVGEGVRMSYSKQSQTSLKFRQILIDGFWKMA